MGEILADQATGADVGMMRSVRPLGAEAALLRAVAGIVRAGEDDLEPSLSAV